MCRIDKSGNETPFFADPAQIADDASWQPLVPQRVREFINNSTIESVNGGMSLQRVCKDQRNTSFIRRYKLEPCDGRRVKFEITENDEIQDMLADGPYVSPRTVEEAEQERNAAKESLKEIAKTMTKEQMREALSKLTAAASIKNQHIQNPTTAGLGLDGLMR
jgi:hypothetical protein